MNSNAVLLLLNEEEPPQGNNKPYIGFSKLPVGYHECVAFRLVTNKYFRPDAKNPGLKQSLLVELKEQVLFMPTYISKKFVDNEQNFDALVNDASKKFLFFGGANPNK